ncbi:MAG: ATP-dependent Clp protease adaptor ClpS [Tepidisphaeraceae bacterium]
MSQAESSSTPQPATPANAPSVSRTKPARRPAPKREQLPPYNVVLINDNDHTYAYVVQMLRHLFTVSEQEGFHLAATVDRSGRAIVCTTHKEKAELKRDQILAYGADPRLEQSRGSMSAVIEPAQK